MRSSSVPLLAPPPSGDGFKFDKHGRAGLKDDLCSTQTHTDSAFSPSHKINIDSDAVGLSPTSKYSGEEEGLLLQESKELVHEETELTSNKSGIFPREEEVDTSIASEKATDKEETEQEIINLRNRVKLLQERERNLETQLLEYYGLKEQEAAMMELQNRLKINNLEVKFFTLKIESLQAENHRLETQTADYEKVVADLESARAKIKMLKKKLRSDEEHNKELLSVLQKSVANLQEQEHMAILNDVEVKNELQRLKELGEESEELKRSNSELQQKNAELARRLESAQILASSILEDPETEELREANNSLSQEKEEIMKELERLRTDRCSDVEELVYLRWVNACLRYELRNYKPSPGKTVARDLSKSLSPTSEEKAKKLVLEYANSEGFVDNKCSSIVDFDLDYWSSSQGSFRTESGDYDDISPTDASFAKRNHHHKSKSKFFKKLKKLVIGNDCHRHRTSPLEKNHVSSAGSGRNDSAASCTSFEDIGGTNSSDTLSSSHNNSGVMETLFTGIGTRSDRHLNNIVLSQSSTSRHSTSRRSMDIQRTRNMSFDDMRDEERIRSSSDLGTSFAIKRIYSSDNLRLDQDQIARDKSELIKFAEVLKGCNGTRKASSSQ